jgi:type VI secretion system protein ImpK
MQLAETFVDIFYYTAVLRQLEFMQVSFDDARKRYEELLTAAERKAKSSGYSAHEWELAGFAVCAFVDECVLCSSWPDKGRWQAAPLQQVYFGTRNAGELFFRNMDGLTENDNDVREVYDYCLAQGFQGRYHSHQQREVLEKKIQDNLARFTGNNEMAFPTVLFPQGYADKPPRPERVRTGPPLVWTVLAAGVPVAAFVVIYTAVRMLLDGMLSRALG